MVACVCDDIETLKTTLRTDNTEFQLIYVKFSQCNHKYLHTLYFQETNKNKEQISIFCITNIKVAKYVITKGIKFE